MHGNYAYFSVQLMRMNKKSNVVQAVSTRKERLKFAGIIFFLMIAATLMGTLITFNIQEWLRWFLGGFMIMFAGFKLIGIEVFIRVFKLYDLIAQRFKPYTYIYPLLQAFIGMWFITGLSPVLRDVVTIGIGLSSLIGILKIVGSRGAIRLAYLGKIIRLRYSTVIIFENTTIVILGLLSLIWTIAFN